MPIELCVGDLIKRRKKSMPVCASVSVGERRNTKLPWGTMVPIGPFPCISCPAGCACSADNPSCSCKRLTKRGGQLPWVCLFPSRPLFHSAQTAHIVQPLFSCQAETFRHTHTHTHIPRVQQHQSIFSLLCSQHLIMYRAASFREREKKTKNKKNSGQQLQANTAS